MTSISLLICTIDFETGCVSPPNEMVKEFLAISVVSNTDFFD